MKKLSRVEDFQKSNENRFRWHRRQQCKYVPTIYSFLDEDEWEIMEEWFKESGEKYTGTGECGVPMMSMIQGFVMGNGLTRIVQLGHYIGYSTLLIGFMLRKMGHKNGLFSIDLVQKVTDFTQKYVTRAGLDEYVKLHVADSSDEKMPGLARKYLHKDPQLIFIDSSHQYQHTLKELDLWVDNLAHGGMLMMHDVSKKADACDRTKEGGVYRAIHEWNDNNTRKIVCLNGEFKNDESVNPLVYLDGCGLGVLIKD